MNIINPSPSCKNTLKAISPGTSGLTISSTASFTADMKSTLNSGMAVVT